MVKAVFFDIDGTLVSFETHRVPDSAMAAIRKLREKGVKVFIATGRRLQAITNLGDLEFDGYITLNGSFCYAGRDQVIFKHPIPNEDIEAMIRYQETVEAFPCAMVQEEDMYFNYADDNVNGVFNMLNIPLAPPRPLREVFTSPVYQLIAFFTQDQEARIMEQMPHCDATRWYPLFADVIPKGISKQVGIDRMIEHFGISLDETMAFGDGGNDISMLRHAGIGVALGNAGDEVKQAADYVTDSVDEDGIWNASTHFGLL